MDWTPFITRIEDKIFGRLSPFAAIARVPTFSSPMFVRMSTYAKSAWAELRVPYAKGSRVRTRYMKTTPVMSPDKRLRAPREKTFLAKRFRLEPPARKWAPRAGPVFVWLVVLLPVFRVCRGHTVSLTPYFFFSDSGVISPAPGAKDRYLAFLVYNHFPHFLVTIRLPDLGTYPVRTRCPGRSFSETPVCLTSLPHSRASRIRRP